MKFTYKNVTDQSLDLVGAGVVNPGETVTTDFEVFNPNFEKVGSENNQDKSENQTENPVPPTQTEPTKEVEL